MKRIALFAVALTCSLTAWADEQVRRAQTELKEQGFFYGEVTGQPGTETSAAVRRYQIRHGLEVTGTLTKQTLTSLEGEAPAGAAPADAAPARNTPPPPVSPPAAGAVEKDKDFLRRVESGSRQSAPVPPPAPGVARALPPTATELPSPAFADFFDETPYATAPRVVQESTVRRAQTQLAARGIYRDPIDGSPGVATEEALLSFQRKNDLPLTGRLDLETLSVLRLLPGRPSTTRVAPGSQVYRGRVVR